MKKKATVFVGMSGGVDSSVAAALLQKEGFYVVGVHLKCWSADRTASCTAADDERSARLAAAHLGIPLYVWNFIDEYKRRVVDYLIEGYRQGITPNPDAMCNREIKFGLFFEKAMRMGADYVATGHYARIGKNGTIERAADQNKDQSYFLSWIAPGVLSGVIFPLGDLTKPQVRTIARKLGLPNAERKDSQGICFVGKVPVEEFLKEYLPVQAGDIVDREGNVLGKHQGAWFYTIGQRQRIGLSGGPYYVAGKDVRNNIVTVTRDERDILQDTARVKGITWFVRVQDGESVNVELRYRQKPVPALVRMAGEDACELSFADPQRAVTPGQAAVFYRQGELAGGGIIE